MRGPLGRVLSRASFDDVLWRQLANLELRWIADRARTYVQLRAERFVNTGFAPPPLLAALAPTTDCNLRCPMCDLPARHAARPEQHETAVWLEAIDQLHAMGAAAIGITGGEPLLRRDVTEMIARARGHGLPVTITTNALLLTEPRARELVAAAPTNVNVSIDSGRHDVNDRLRGGRNVLARTLERVRLLRDLRSRERGSFGITIVTVLSDDNIDDLDVLFASASDAGADRIGFMPLHSIDRRTCAVEPAKKDTSTLADRIRELSRRYSLPVENSDDYLDGMHRVWSQGGGMPFRCNAPYTSLILGPELDLYPCFPHYEKDAPIARWSPSGPSLGEIWSSAVFRRARRDLEHCRECFWNCHAELNYVVPM